MMYVLISGRWFKGNAVEAPWEFVPANELPPDFAKIPVDSPKAHVLASVAGSPEAEQAVLEAGIPQTAVVSLQDHSFVPVFDGPPQFADIPGTSLKVCNEQPQQYTPDW